MAQNGIGSVGSQCTASMAAAGISVTMSTIGVATRRIGPTTSRPSISGPRCATRSWTTVRPRSGGGAPSMSGIRRIAIEVVVFSLSRGCHARHACMTAAASAPS